MNGKNVNFYVSTGTGNTLVCARAVSGVLTENGYSVILKKLEDGFEDDNSVIGIALPVILMSAFPYVWKFADNLPEGKGREIFFLSTYGLQHHDVQSPFGTMFRKKGYKLLGAKNIYMPHNLFDRAKDKTFFANSVKNGIKESQEFAAELVHGTSVWKCGSFKAYFKTKLSRTRWLWEKFRKKLTVYCDTVKCVKCGRCVSLCPVGNIYMKGNPEFKTVCELCSRCVAFCPVHALDFKGKESPQYRAVEFKDLL
jgi:ferredoxin